MRFTEVKRGYDKEEVDTYIQSLDNVIRSYKEKDNTIKNAIISAQMAADNMIKNAKLQADEYKHEILRELNKVREEIERKRIKIQEFNDTYSHFVGKYLTKLDGNDAAEMVKPLDEIDRLIDHFSQSEMVSIAPGDASTPAVEFRMLTKSGQPKPELSSAPQPQIPMQPPQQPQVPVIHYTNSDNISHSPFHYPDAQPMQPQAAPAQPPIAHQPAAQPQMGQQPMGQQPVQPYQQQAYPPFGQQPQQQMGQQPQQSPPPQQPPAPPSNEADAV